MDLSLQILLEYNDLNHVNQSSTFNLEMSCLITSLIKTNCNDDIHTMLAKYTSKHDINMKSRRGGGRDIYLGIGPNISDQP